MDEPLRPYNPLDRVELGKSVELALLRRPLVALDGFLARRPKELPGSSHKKFPGAGLYALYYIGDLPCYEAIAPPHQPVGEVPIYVGRASPKGARQGALGLESTSDDPVLFERLRGHARSILATQDPDHATEGLPLSVAHFLCRYLVADDIWVPLGEALLIGHYRPVWNILVDGFGNHGPGGGREMQARSFWDTLHPGRKFAYRLPESAKSAREIETLVVRHLAGTERPDLDAAPMIDEQVRRALLDQSND